MQGWSRILRARRGDVEGTAPPDRNDEYLLYQLLVGSWPVELLSSSVLETENGRAGLATYAARIRGTLEKSMREAKRHSNWSAPDEAYENALQGFASDALDATRPGFLAVFLPFAQHVARLGVDNALVQLVLKLTLPGVPDIYQGAELWDLSLVDPDNRRPVDYEARDAMLRDLAPRLDGDGRNALVTALYRDWESGAIKLALTRVLLALRADAPALFADGDYEPLDLGGDDLLGFARNAGGRRMRVVVRRFGTRAADIGGIDHFTGEAPLATLPVALLLD